MVDDAASTEGHDSVLLGNREREMLPVNEIATDRMSPAHVPPSIARRIVLIEEMILASMIDQAVGVVHPIDFWTEVELRSKRLIHVALRSAIFCKAIFEIKSLWRSIRLNDVVNVDVSPSAFGMVIDSQSNLLSFQVAVLITLSSRSNSMPTVFLSAPPPMRNARWER